MWNVLIIGAGGQGAFADAPGSGNEDKIISYAHAFSNMKHAFETYIMDTNTLKMREACKIWGLKEYECRHYDVVVIATPDNVHYGNLMDTLICKPKLVICEKPICTGLQQAREIVALYKEKGIPLMVDYTRRFIPELERLKERGQPEYATCEFNRGFLHTGSHAVDFFLWLNAKNYRLIEVPIEGCRIWKLSVFWKDSGWIEQRFYDMPVPSYYDYHMKYVVENAYNFLEGKESLKCSGEDALKTLEITYKLMEESR